jgi:hypothetical protein
MTAPDELQRAVKALTDMRDAARDGTPVTDPNEWEFDELTRILAAFHFLLSERAELLATVERMRGEMAGMETRLRRWEPRVSLDLSVACAITRAALTTGEEK